MSKSAVKKAKVQTNNSEEFDVNVGLRNGFAFCQCARCYYTWYERQATRKTFADDVVHMCDTMKELL